MALTGMGLEGDWPLSPPLRTIPEHLTPPGEKLWGAGWWG